MLYREAGQYKSSYEADQAVFPLLQDRIGIALILFVAFVVVPLTMSSFTISSVMIPVLIFALAAIGLNILTGYTGLISLGTGGFMGVGAYACYKLTTTFPGVNIIFMILASGFFSAAIGALFGLPSLRIKGFYLAVATLAAQFFLSWCFIRIPWLYNYNVSAAIEVPTRTLFGVPITGPTATPAARYLVVLGIVILMTWLASNLVHGRIGRMWMAVRDMDIAAELIGIRLYRTKLLGVCGVVVLLRRRRRPDGVHVARRRGSRQLQHQRVVPDPVHGDHRRARQPRRLVLRRGLHLGAADRAARAAGAPRRADQCRDGRAPAVHDRRGAHHLLPDRRTARARPAVADREAETQGVAVSLLMVHTEANVRRGLTAGGAE